MKVFVYFNLRKRCWSIKALEGPRKGRVIGHAKRVLLTDCTFKVSEAGRQRVLREKRKNVHAGVVGTMYSEDSFLPHDAPERPGLGPMEEQRILRGIEAECERITYNPYKYTSFVVADDDRLQARTAGTCYINERGVFAKQCTYYIPEFDTTKEG